ncbi:MAG: FAD-binding oxidoreductase [Myxococcales bacterium]|jgi:FAD/FMN-containing dehydrogenase
MTSSEGQLSGWGRTFVPGHEIRSENLERITPGAVLTRGLGRSYGDGSLPPAGVVEIVGTTLADRLLSFDEDTGVLRAEAGVSLVELNRLLLPRGWFTPVTPGTQYVTLGGMVASDVHGKNHHVAGCIGRHVQSLKMVLADGRVVKCSRQERADLFLATLGGMGLTGHIVEVELRMERVPSPWIYSTSRRVPDIDTLLDGLREAAEAWPFTVGWIDSLAGSGRGHLYCGRWATPEEAPKDPPKPKGRITMPLTLPSGTVNGFTVGLFNMAWYWKIGSKEKAKVVHPESYFYPLDMILQWNRAYGKRGVTQYQCVIPRDAGREPVRELLKLLKQFGTASFLTVVKDCGDEGEGILSFPKPGISVALDLPIDDRTQETVDALNEMMIRVGGRIYLTKDGFTTAEHFRAMETRLERFTEIRERYNPGARIRSGLSTRLLGD